MWGRWREMAQMVMHLWRRRCIRKSLHCRRDDTVLSTSLRMMWRGEEELQIEGPCESGGAKEGMKVL